MEDVFEKFNNEWMVYYEYINYTQKLFEHEVSVNVTMRK